MTLNIDSKLLSTAEGSESRTPTISDAEKNRRKIAADYARASIGLEGLKITDEHEAQIKRFINGELDFDELTKTVHEQVKRSHTTLERCADDSPTRSLGLT